MISSQTVFIMMAWLVLCFTGLMGHIANGAHFFGLLGGIVWSFGHGFLRDTLGKN
jgi:membrane associated rhomboid family serine protease